jgi:hypothetical protein
MIAIVDPQASRRRGGGRRACPRWGQYLSPLLKRQGRKASLPLTDFVRVSGKMRLVW